MTLEAALRAAAYEGRGRVTVVANHNPSLRVVEPVYEADGSIEELIFSPIVAWCVVVEGGIAAPRPVTVYSDAHVADHPRGVVVYDYEDWSWFSFEDTSGKGREELLAHFRRKREESSA